MQSSQFQPITSSQYSGISTEDLGTDNVPHSYHQKTNSNGQCLITNTRFQKAEKKLWTWLSPPDCNQVPPDCNQVKHKQQIDFILVRRKWQNSIMDTQAYNSFASVGSDHRVVSANVRLSLRAPKQKVERMMKCLDGFRG